MTPEQKREPIDRINRHRTAPRATDTMAASMRVPTTVFTDPEHLQAERELLVTMPNLVGLSGLLPGPNTLRRSMSMGGRS